MRIALGRKHTDIPRQKAHLQRNILRCRDHTEPGAHEHLEPILGVRRGLVDGQGAQTGGGREDEGRAAEEPVEDQLGLFAEEGACHERDEGETQGQGEEEDAGARGADGVDGLEALREEDDGGVECEAG